MNLEIAVFVSDQCLWRIYQLVPVMQLF